MKYILIIFIFVSFLFSQDYAQQSEAEIYSTGAQVDEYDENGRPINAKTDEMEIQDYTLQPENSTLVDEYDENGRPINTK